MAGLSGRRRDPGRGRDCGDFADDRRGQLMLVFALGIAVLLVVLALLVGGATSAGNAASRSVDDGAVADAVAVRFDAERFVRGRVAAANDENDSSYVTLRDAVAAGVDRWGELRATHAGGYGRGVGLTLAGTRNGTRIRDANDSRALTNESGVDDWTLASGSAATRSFRVNVSRASLVDAAGQDSNASSLKNEDVFRVAVDDGVDRRTVYVYQDGTDEVLVRVGDGSGSLSDVCRQTAGPDGHVVVDLSNGTLGGDPCQSLSVFDAVGAGHSIAYRDGTNATGTYALVVDRPVSEVNDTDYAARGSGRYPVATPALYAVTVRVEYRTDRLDYAATLEVVPGDRDE